MRSASSAFCQPAQASLPTISCRLSPVPQEDKRALYVAHVASTLQLLGETGEEAAVLSVHAYPKNIDYLVVCNRSSSVFLMTREGHVLRTFDMVDKESKEDFVACIVSPRGGYVYCLAANMKMYCFDAETGRMVDAYAVADKGCIGLTHHPMQNLVATYGEDCKLKFWHPS